MKRAYLWRSVLGQRLAADLTATDFRRFGQWLTENQITDDDLIELVRDWRSTRAEGESFLEYLDRFAGGTARPAGNGSPTGSLRMDSMARNVPCHSWQGRESPAGGTHRLSNSKSER
jgi:hypothetical protein